MLGLTVLFIYADTENPLKQSDLGTECMQQCMNCTETYPEQFLLQ